MSPASLKKQRQARHETHCHMRKALTDKKLLGNVLAGDSWLAWRTLLIASMGEALDR